MRKLAGVLIVLGLSIMACDILGGIPAADQTPPTPFVIPGGPGATSTPESAQPLEEAEAAEPIPPDQGGGGLGGGGGGGMGGGGGGGGGMGDYYELGPSAGEPLEQGAPTPDMMFFEDYGVNPFFDAAQDNLSTFAIDVDTGSFVLTRQYLRDGWLPPPEAIRLEEFVNYFDQDYPPPTQEEVFNIVLQAAPTPFSAEGNYVLRVGIQGYDIPPEQRPDANLVFVIDVSGSMDREDRLEAVKEALYALIDQLRPTDTIGIVVYSTNARVVLQPTPVSEADTIRDAIAQGLEFGYEMAGANYDAARINRIILCSDGVANVGDTDPALILESAREQVREGITLTTIGFGMGNYNDVILEQLADDGNGRYYYVDTQSEARRLFVERLTGTLVDIAADVRIQVAFNPETVAYYRLMGYENREIADEQFRDDTVDAGEIGAGHSVTALYEIVPTDWAAQGVIATAYLHWEDPETGQPAETSRSIEVWERAPSFETVSARFQLDVVVAAFADLLGGGGWAQNATWSELQFQADRMVEGIPDDPDVGELADMIAQAMDLQQ
jgi:Ca-activated chloride channel family protein